MLVLHKCFLYYCYYSVCEQYYLEQGKCPMWWWIYKIYPYSTFYLQWYVFEICCGIRIAGGHLWPVVIWKTLSSNIVTSDRMQLFSTLSEDPVLWSWRWYVVMVFTLLCLAIWLMTLWPAGLAFFCIFPHTVPCKAEKEAIEDSVLCINICSTV